MRTVLQLAAPVTFAVALLGQAPPKDVDGWDKFKWGMTISDVSRIYTVEGREENQFWDHIRVSPITVGDMIFKVAFVAKHGSDRIAMVQLTRLISDATFSPRDFDTLKTLLTQKYGQPANEAKKTPGDPVDEKDATWVFPSTSIVLEMGSLGITVEYTGIDKKALDKL